MPKVDALELTSFKFPSIYMKGDTRYCLPDRMALLRPNTVDMLMDLDDRVQMRGGTMYLSDAFRARTAQLKAHLDWKEGRKRAYSPPPGSSCHEAALAIDYDVKAICDTIDGGFNEFWDIAHDVGWSFVIPEPDPGMLEAWHLEHRSHGFRSLAGRYGYKYAVQWSIRALGFPVDENQTDDWIEYIQGTLAALGFDPGPIDGIVGRKTIVAVLEFLRDPDISGTDLDDQLLRYLRNVGFELKSEFLARITSVTHR